MSNSCFWNKSVDPTLSTNSWLLSLSSQIYFHNCINLHCALIFTIEEGFLYQFMMSVSRSTVLNYVDNWIEMTAKKMKMAVEYCKSLLNASGNEFQYVLRLVLLLRMLLTCWFQISDWLNWFETYTIHNTYIYVETIDKLFPFLS